VADSVDTARGSRRRHWRSASAAPGAEGLTFRASRRRKVVEAADVSSAHGDFVFAGLRLVLSWLGADDPRSRRFRPVVWFVFGAPLAFFLLVDRVSLSSYRWSELWFLLGYLAAAVFGCVFRLYQLADARTEVGARLRVALRPVGRTWVHLVLAVVAAGIQVVNFRAARVDVTFGSRHLVHFLGVTTSSTGVYEMFGAALFTYCGFVLLLKIGLILHSFTAIFAPRFTRVRDRVTALETLLRLDHIALSGIAFFGLYLLCWRTGGFAQVVPVNESFYLDVVALVLVTIPAVGFTLQSHSWLVDAHDDALRRFVSARANRSRVPAVWQRATRLVFGCSLAVAYLGLALVFLLISIVATEPRTVEGVVSYSSPLFNAFLGSPLALFAAWVITSKLDRVIDRVGDDYRRLLEA
jgi:hypothetical protein